MARKDRPKRRPEALETVGRFEPALLEQLTSPVTDVIAEISATSAALGKALNSKTAANLADLVRVMNTYYSNLIEGHDTRPRDIERALAGHLDDDHERRNLQLEAAAHVRVQKQVDEMAAAGRLPEPASSEFLRELHREFYREAPQATLIVRSATRSFKMTPGEWRSRPEQDVAVGRPMPPSSGRVGAFISAFAERDRVKQMGKATPIQALAACHQPLNQFQPI